MQQAEPEPPPILFEYEVQPGDTVSEIAERFGMATANVVWNNIDVLEDADSLVVGAVLQIPGVPGIIHSVRLGDTVSEIAERYDASISDIVEFEANGFHGDPDNLLEGSLILVPHGRRIPPPAPEAPAAQPAAAPTPAPTPAPPQWVWPATGRLTNVFSARHPLGIDISMRVATPIVAASSGQVVFVGGNPCCSYGYHVIIEHADGYETLYAHLNEFAVGVGDWVQVGQLIGRSGNTGYSTGPHLHFEVRRNGIHRDPLIYLP
jgi:murein DD-endopeptidase MepM/ murein hydrolase activator NlpD